MHNLFALVATLIGALLFWRAVVNLNAMDRHTHHGIKFLNGMLMVGGAGLVCTPLIAPAERYAYIAAFALGVQVVFLICMFIGRRPTDRVLSA